MCVTVFIHSSTHPPTNTPSPQLSNLDSILVQSGASIVYYPEEPLPSGGSKKRSLDGKEKPSLLSIFI